MLAGDMAEIAGTVLNDLQGDGNAANDVAAAGVTVNLYRDNGNGVFDAGADTQAAPSTVTDAEGRYSFASLSAGNYFVQIAPPSDMHTQAGGDVRSVTVTPDDATGVLGRTIDGFDSIQRVEAAPPLPSSEPSSLADPAVLGNERDMFVELTNGVDQYSSVSLTTGGSLLRLASDTTVTGNAKVVWDGADGDALQVDPTGLGGIDLTTFEGNTMTGISLTVGADHPEAKVKLKVYTDANNWSEYSAIVPQSIGGAATGQLVIQFDETPTSKAGSGADFSNVGAIELNFEGVSAVDGQVSKIELVGLTKKSADFTVFDRLSLGDHVWSEILNDGLHDAAEPGIAGVKVNLFDDTDGNGKFTQGVDALLATDTTDANGDYRFADLFPGDYLVQVDPSNFSAGGPLANMRSSTGNGLAVDPDDDRNGDDNGDPVSGAGVASLAVTLTSGQEPTNDGDSDPNTNLTVDFGFFGFDLEIDKSVDKQSALPGDKLSYSIVITNTGPSTAEDVSFTDTLPDGVSFVSANSSSGASVSANSNGVLESDLGDIAGGTSVTVTVVATIDQLAQGTICNIAQVSAPQELNTSNNSDDACIELTPVIDLSITKTDSRDPVEPGSTFSYTLVATNHGPSNATGVVITDQLPDFGVSFVSASRAPDRVTNDFLEFNVGNLAVGQSTSVTITVQVDESFSGTLLNEASVIGDQVETTLDNNQDEEPTVVPKLIDLAITKVDSQDPVEPGETFSYNVTATNLGPSGATGVVITDQLPATGVSFVSATRTPANISGNTLEFEIGDVAAGETVTLSITVRVDDSFSGTLLNEVAIIGNQNEITLANNQDDEPTVVNKLVDLLVSKTDSHDPVESGTTFSYDVTATNTGPSGASGVVVTDKLPPSVTFVSATRTPSSINGNTLEFEIGNLAAGETTTFSITVRVDDSFFGTMINEVSIIGNENEITLSNNQDDESTVVPAPASVAGTVFVDRNDNGIFDSGEATLSGVTISLFGTTDGGSPINRTTVTGANGSYRFDNLPAGTYNVVQVAQPNRYKDGKDELGDNGDGAAGPLNGFKAPDLNDDDDRDSDAFEGIVLSAGNDGTRYNFGELALGLSKVDFIRPVVYA